ELGNDEGNNYYQASCGVFGDSVDLTFNLTDGIELDKVVVSGYVDDHIEFTVNGQTAFSHVDGTNSFTRPLPNTSYPSCDIGHDIELGRHYFSGDKTFGFKRYFTPDTTDTYTIAANVLVGDAGE